MLEVLSLEVAGPWKRPELQPKLKADRAGAWPALAAGGFGSVRKLPIVGEKP